MADNGIIVKVQGIDKLKRLLASLPRTLRRKVLVKALRAGARVVLKATRAAVPVLFMPAQYRTKGLLKKRLSVRVSKESRLRGNVGVFVNVKPLKTGWGAKNPNDPYYWRWAAFGAKPHLIAPKLGKTLKFGNLYMKKPVKHPGMKGVNFLQAGADALPAALAAFEREAIPSIEALNKSGS